MVLLGGCYGVARWLLGGCYCVARWLLWCCYGLARWLLWCCYVDAFNNYGDRVNFDFNGGKRVEGMTERCKCLWNPGNFFVDGNEGVLGLDAIDPNTEFNNWEKMPEIPTGSEYSGRILRTDNGQKRKEDRCTSDL